MDVKPLDDDKIIEEARERYDLAVEAEAQSREDRRADLAFEGGEQWPDRIRHARENDPDGPRPCLTINLARKHKQSIVNDIRKNRPAIKVLPVDDKADVETAKIFNGLLRHINAVSDGDIATDTAADSQVTTGLGYFRINTQVVDEDRNEQEICIESIKNPFSVYLDPESMHPAGADANWGFVTDEVSRKRFEIDYPDAEVAGWEDVSSSGSQLAHWYPSKDTILIAEYFVVTRGNAADGKEATGGNWKKDRRCQWYKLAGDQILEHRELPTSYVPIIKVTGEERLLESHRDFRGIIRDIRDPAQIFNYLSSTNVERLSLTHKVPYMAPAEAIEGHEDEWAKAHTSNKAYLPYNQFDSEGNRIDQPKRTDPASVNTGIVQAMQQAQEDVRSVSGQSQAGFGERSNEQSGRAINARRSEQDTNTFHFVDNLAISMKHAGRVIIEMIPFVYDTRRIVRILGEDDAPDFAQFDPTAPRSMQEVRDITGEVMRIYNPSIGRYDVRVTVGPGYATKMEEGAERLGQIIQSAPDMLSIAGDVLFRNMDIPGAEDLAERMKALLPPQIQELEKAKKSGQEQGMQQAEMVRQETMAQIAPMVEELKQALDMAAQENDQLTGMVQQLKAALDDKQADLQLKAAELEAKRYEAELKLQAEMADSESDVAVAYIQAQSAPKESERVEHRENGNADSGGQLAAMMAQQAVAMMQRMSDELSAKLEATASSVASTAMGLQSMHERHDSIEQQAKALQSRVDQADVKRREMQELAAKLLAGQITDEEAAKAIRH